MTSYGPDEWFWAMFEPTWTWPNFSFDQLFMWIGANNDQIWLPLGYASDSEQQFEPTPTWPNFTFGQLFMGIGANNDQMWLPVDQKSDSELCLNWLQLDLISLLGNFYVNWENNDQIWLTRGYIVILNNVQADSN